MIRVAVHGERGRMGQRVSALARADERFEVVGGRGRDASSRDVERDSIDLVIDFSSPDGAVHAASIASAAGAALVCGTTGLSPGNLQKLGDSARLVPVLIAPNTSLGVAVVRHVVCEAARLLGDAFDIDIVETHHTAKRDAPSGTALRIVDDLAARTGVRVGPERVHAIRAGDVIGEHEITFAGPGERIRIVHMATTRDLFARGALEAGAWLVRQPPGQYAIEDALGISRSETAT